MSVNVQSNIGEVEIRRLPVNSEENVFNGWAIKYEQSHILHSQCSHKTTCTENTEPTDLCLFCRYNSILHFPHLPDMVFPNNSLMLRHNATNAQIEFNALDALKRVNVEKLPLQVACAGAWQDARPDTKVDGSTKQFDWTFSTDYSGTLTNIVSETTEERIDLEKLKQREQILFFHELTLFEDELHDHGVASLSVKIRVMPSSFFVLQRYFLRVDNVMARINDTRIFHEFGQNYLLKEYTSREGGMQELLLPIAVYTDSNQLSQYLPLKTSLYEKLQLATN